MLCTAVYPEHPVHPVKKSGVLLEALGMHLDGQAPGSCVVFFTRGGVPRPAFLSEGSYAPSSACVVEARGLEPLTLWLPAIRSPN